MNEMGPKLFETLSGFIVENNMSLWTIQTFIPDEEAKTYMVKFLFSLLRKKRRGNYIIEEIEETPQIDLLMVNLMQTVVGVKDIVVDSNCFGI